MTAVFVIIIIASVALITLPFVKKSSNELLIEQTLDPRIELSHKKENLLQSIRELDFDYETGKLSPQDYKQLRANLERQTVDTMKNLERVQAKWDEMVQQT